MELLGMEIGMEMGMEMVPGKADAGYGRAHGNLLGHRLKWSGSTMFLAEVAT